VYCFHPDFLILGSSFVKTGGGGGTQYPEFGGPLWTKSGSYIVLLFCQL